MDFPVVGALGESAAWYLAFQMPDLSNVLAFQVGEQRGAAQHFVGMRGVVVGGFLIVVFELGVKLVGDRVDLFKALGLLPLQGRYVE